MNKLSEFQAADEFHQNLKNVKIPNLSNQTKLS
jgi:hypothetical protein